MCSGRSNGSRPRMLLPGTGCSRWRSRARSALASSPAPSGRLSPALAPVRPLAGMPSWPPGTLTEPATGPVPRTVLMPEPTEQEVTAGQAAGADGEGRRARVPEGLILALACVAQFMVVLDVSIV